MANSNWLRTQKQEFDAAIETLANFYSSVPAFLPVTSGNTSDEVLDATRRVVSICSRLRSLLAGPDDLIQHLAQQSQLLASIKWLGDHQILAAIPLCGYVLLKDVADLAGVPETQLRRVARMTATSGFLQENSDGGIAHTNLSASFVMDLSLSDAITFLAETSTPTALSMNAVESAEHRPNTEESSAYCAAFGTSKSFRRACLERPKLQRQWCAYRKHTGDVEQSIVALMSRLDWSTLENARIIEACAHSSEDAIELAERYPVQQVIVQVTHPPPNRGRIEAATSLTEGARGRVTVQSRVPGAVQSAKHSAVYIVRVALGTPNLRSYIISELRAHIVVLRKNTSSILMLAAPLLPAPTVADPDVESKARLQDLCHAQLNNEWQFELEDLLEIVDGVCDNRGKFVVVNQVQSEHHVTVALTLKYQDFAQHP